MTLDVAGAGLVGLRICLPILKLSAQLPSHGSSAPAFHTSMVHATVAYSALLLQMQQETLLAPIHRKYKCLLQTLAVETATLSACCNDVPNDGDDAA